MKLYENIFKVSQIVNERLNNDIMNQNQLFDKVILVKQFQLKVWKEEEIQ